MHKSYLLFTLSIVIGCQSSPSQQTNDSTKINHVESDSSLNFVKDNNGRYVEKEKIDSFKWILYAAGFESEALNGEDTKMPKLRPVQCSFSFDNVRYLGRDTAKYSFMFYYKDPDVYYLLDPNNEYGVATIKNVNRYLVGGNWQMDIPATPRLSEKFFAKQDSLFRLYLKTYNGEMNEWLRNEAIRRGVLAR